MISQKDEPVVEKPVTSKETPDLETQENKEVTPAPDMEYLTMKEIDENTIVLDGPLSQVYTDALNKAYARESYITEIAAIKDSADDQTEKEEENPAIGNYIYLVDGKYLEGDEYVNVFNNLQVATEMWANVYVCIEHHGNITNRVAEFRQICREMKAIVMDSREEGLEFIRSKMKG